MKKRINNYRLDLLEQIKAKFYDKKESLKLRTTCEIIADLKDGKEVAYEELKMACLVQSSIIFLYQQDTKNLLKGGIGADLVVQMNYKDDKTSSKKLGYPSWYWNAIKKDPIEWLGASNIPGTSEYNEHYKLSKALFEKFANKNGDKQLD